MAAAPLVIVTTSEELRRIVAEEIRQAFAQQAPPANDTCDWIDVTAAAVILGCHPGYVRRLKGVPMHRVGTKLRFRRSELEAFILSGAARRQAR